MPRYVLLISLLVAPLIAKGSTWIRWSCGDDYWVEYHQGCCSVLNPESVTVTVLEDQQSIYETQEETAETQEETVLEELEREWQAYSRALREQSKNTVALDPAGKDWVSDATKTPVYKFIANKNAVGRYHYALLVEDNGVTTEITCERLF